MRGTSLLPARRFSIPALGASAQVTLVEDSILPASSEDLYHLAWEVDSDGVLDEQDEGNNQVETTIPVVVTTTLCPDATSALTSNSGHLAFLFPAGTVTMPAEIRFTPLLTSGVPPGPPLGVVAFQLAAYQGGQPVPLSLLRPVTVTWQYTDTDVAELDEDALGLYRLAESNHWQRVSCPAEQHQPEVNRLSTHIQQLGKYVLGQGYEWLIPLMLASGEASQSEAQPSTPGALPGLALRLPPWANPPASR
jgi:hypothetical protein